MMKVVRAAFAISLLAVPAMAASPYSDRLHNDQRRIERESHDRSLSQFEARRFQHEGRYIEGQRRAALSDGRLSGRERGYLREMQAQHRRNIWRERRD